MENPVHIEALKIEIERLTQENSTLAGFVVELRSLAKGNIPYRMGNELHEFLEQRKRQTGVDSTSYRIGSCRA